jgi:hypothetical protein
MNITFISEDEGRKVTISCEEVLTWSEQASLFMDFLRGQSYVIPYDVLGDYISKEWASRLDAETNQRKKTEDNNNPGLTD